MHCCCGIKISFFCYAVTIILSKQTSACNGRMSRDCVRSFTENCNSCCRGVDLESTLSGQAIVRLALSMNKHVHVLMPWQNACFHSSNDMSLLGAIDRGAKLQKVHDNTEAQSQVHDYKGTWHAGKDVSVAS